MRREGKGGWDGGSRGRGRTHRSEAKRLDSGYRGCGGGLGERVGGWAGDSIAFSCFRGGLMVGGGFFFLVMATCTMNAPYYQLNAGLRK